MNAASNITISGPEDGQVLNVLGAPIRVQSSGRNDQMFFADHPVPDGYAVPLHVHRDEDELFYIVDGEITLISDNGEALAGPGTFIHLPHGAAHGFANRSGKPAHMLVVTTPGGGLHPAFSALDRLTSKGELTPEAIGAALAENRIDMA